MNDAQLQGFRDIAASMRPDVPHDWQWIGPHMSQRMFGITEEKAKEYAARYGGTAAPLGTAEDEARAWLLAHENSEDSDGNMLRSMARIVLGREPTAEDWDRLPEIVREGGAA